MLSTAGRVVSVSRLDELGDVPRMTFIFISILILGAVFAALGAWRFFFVRSTGTPIILRKLPGNGLHGWRHGVVRYAGTEMRYFKLRSLTPSADIVFNRSAVLLEGHRETSSREAPILLGSKSVILFAHEGNHYEAVFPAGADMAFISWVESAPDARLERVDLHSLRRRFSTQ